APFPFDCHATSMTRHSLGHIRLPPPPGVTLSPSLGGAPAGRRPHVRIGATRDRTPTRRASCSVRIRTSVSRPSTASNPTTSVPSGNGSPIAPRAEEATGLTHVPSERERITDRSPRRGNEGIVRRTVSAHRCDRVSVDRHTVTVQIGISFPRGHPHLGRDLGGPRPGERDTETFRVLEDRGRVA